MASTIYEMEISVGTDEHMGQFDLVPFLHAKKYNVPSLDPDS